VAVTVRSSKGCARPPLVRDEEQRPAVAGLAGDGAGTPDLV